MMMVRIRGPNDTFVCARQPSAPLTGKLEIKHVVVIVMSLYWLGASKHAVPFSFP